MLDEYISAISRVYFPFRKSGKFSSPVVYLAKSHWIDRLHQYVLALLRWRHEETRLNSVHQYLLPPILENNTTNLTYVTSITVSNFNLFFCGLDIDWKCNALVGDDISPEWSPEGKMNIGVHIMFRLARLQRIYPRLHFDLTISSFLVVG